jgi:ABC-type amino acid transport substrate-binding protein
MRSVLLFLLLCFAVPALGVNITIYTKDFAPFSLNGKGYAIEYAERLILNLYGQTATTDIVVLPGNQEIFDNVLNHTDTATDFTMGTAGISITAAREAILDFSPAFFQSGFQVLTHSSTSFSQLLRRVVRNICIYFGLLVLACVVLVITVAPLAWFFEMSFVPKDKVPIFIDWNSRRDLKPIQCGDYVCDCITPRVVRMFTEFWHAFLWTMYTMAGVETGYPHSIGARYIHIFLKAMKLLIFTISVGAVAAISAASSTTTKINGYGDLDGHTVCTVTGSTSEVYLKANPNGFNILEATDLSEMFDNFWTRKCDAVVYDFPALQTAIVDRANTGQSADAVIVGPLFNKESYGIVFKPGNPNYETLKQYVIALNADHGFIADLEEKWLKKTAGVTGEDDVDLPVALYVVPSVTGPILLILVIAWMYRNYDKKNHEYIKLRNEMANRDYAPELRDLVELEGGNDSILMGQDETIDRWLTPMIIRSLRVLYELELRWKGRDVHEVERDVLPQDVNRTFYGDQAPHADDALEMGHL